MPRSTSTADGGTPTGPGAPPPAGRSGHPGQRRPRQRPRPRAAPRPAPRGPRRLVDTPGPDPGAPPEQVRLTIGTIVGVHGLRGELKLRLSTDDPERLPTLRRVWLGDEERARRLRAVRFHGELALIRVDGYDTPEAGRELVGLPVRISGADARPLAPGEFFLYQLIGLAVEDETGASLGVVTDLMETGAHDVLVVSPPSGPDILLPNRPEVVLDVRPAEGRMVVRPLVYDE